MKKTTEKDFWNAVEYIKIVVLSAGVFIVLIPVAKFFLGFSDIGNQSEWKHPRINDKVIVLYDKEVSHWCHFSWSINYYGEDECSDGTITKTFTLKKGDSFVVKGAHSKHHPDFGAATYFLEVGDFSNKEFEKEFTENAKKINKKQGYYESQFPDNKISSRIYWTDYFCEEGYDGPRADCPEKKLFEIVPN